MIPRGKPAAEGGIELPGREHMHGEAAQDLQDDQNGDDCVQEPQVHDFSQTCGPKEDAKGLRQGIRGKT